MATSKPNKKANQTKSAGPVASASDNDDMLTRADLEKLLDGVREGVRADVTSMKDEILTELRGTISALQTTVSSHGRQINEHDEALSDQDARLTALEKSHSELQTENAKLQARLDDQENRSRRQNVRVVGLPEKVEGTHPTPFVESFLVEVFGKDSFPREPQVDRAHRTLRPPQPNGPPRAMIVRLHHYQTRELILRLSWERSGKLMFRGHKISFYQDLSADLVRRRAVFIPAKRQLHAAGVKFSLAYPATLRFSFKGARHEFKSAQDAETYIAANVLPSTKNLTHTDDMPALEGD